MHNPMEGLKAVSEKMGWANQILGEDFWKQIQEGMRPLQPSSPPPGRREGGQRPAGPTPKSPPVDLYLSPTAVVLYITAPGLTGPEQVGFSLAGPATLVVEAFIPPSSSGGVPMHQERFSGYCARAVELPAAVSAAGVTARYEDGLLEVHLPRLEPGPSGDGVSLLRVSPA